MMKGVMGLAFLSAAIAWLALMATADESPSSQPASRPGQGTKDSSFNDSGSATQP